MNFKRVYFSLISIFWLFASCSNAFGRSESRRLPELIVFHSPGCHICIEAKKEILPEIEKEFKGKIKISYRDVTALENYKFLLTLRNQYSSQERIILPVFFFEGRFVYGRGEIKNNLKRMIMETPLSITIQEEPKDLDLVTRFKKFTPFAVTGAGLIDGINPCAFTVIVFFISFLALQGYRKKEIIAIGLSFISAVFLTYFLLGLGIFNFLYQMEGFWLATRILNICVGTFSIVLGILAVCDFFKFKKTGATVGLFLQLPQSVKNRIHHVIGLHYRKAKTKQATEQKHVFGLIIAALSTGFLVSVLEAICTGQTYLPTITFILKTTQLKLSALGYLLLYNFMFIVPLLIIFLFSLLGVTSEEFSIFLKKHLLIIKTLMAILFFGLGIFLIWRA